MRSTEFNVIFDLVGEEDVSSLNIEYHQCPVNFEKIPCPTNRSGGLASLRNDTLLMIFAVFDPNSMLFRMK